MYARVYLFISIAQLGSVLCPAKPIPAFNLFRQFSNQDLARAHRAPRSFGTPVPILLQWGTTLLQR